jgi:hypothetical protein
MQKTRNVIEWMPVELVKKYLEFQVHLERTISSKKRASLFICSFLNKLSLTQINVDFVDGGE